MSWRATILLLLLASAAIGYLLFSEHTVTHSPEEPLLGINPTLASAIQIQEGNSLLSLIKTNGLWMIHHDSSDHSLTDRANPQLVNTILETAADITPLDIIKPTDLKGELNLTSLDLKKRSRSITIVAGKRASLWIGVGAAAPHTLYASLDSDKTIYLISSKIASETFRPIQDYRDPQLTSLDPDHVSEITITKGLALQQIKLKKDFREKYGWLLETPLSAKGDDQSITRLIHSLLDSPISRWMPEGGDPSSCGLDSPSEIISIREEGVTNPVTIAIGAAAPEANSYFVQCSERPGICVLGGEISTVRSATPQTLRSKTITPVDYDTVDRIEIKNMTGKHSLTRKAGSDDWVLQEDKAPAQSLSWEKMTPWYSQLEGLMAVSFEPATPEHLKERGLENIGLASTNEITTIRLIARLSENTAQENKGDRVIANYTIGPAVNGEIALREGDATDLMILPASALEFVNSLAAPIPISSMPK